MPTQAVEAILFQGDIHKEPRHRHLARHCATGRCSNQNVVIVGGVGGVSAGPRIQRHLRRDRPLYHVFTNVILTF